MVVLNRRRQMNQDSLPYDTEIEYLQSDGYQIIDTGVMAYTTNSYSIQCRVVNLDTNRKIICGSYKGQGDRSLAVEFGGTSNRYPQILRGWVQSDGRNENLWTSTAMGLNTDIDVYWEWDSSTKELKITGTDGTNSVDQTSNALGSTPTASSAQTFWLFKDHRSSSEATAISYPLQIKYLQLYCNGVLVRHFIPVRVGTTGYMYDKVTKQLFGNQGTGDFILGSDIIPIEYLESTGTDAYIDTGITPTLSYSVEIEFSYISLDKTTDASGNLFGCIDGWAKNMFVTVLEFRTWKLWNCWGNKTSDITDKTYLEGLVGSWHTLVYKDYKTTIDGVQKGNTISGPTGNPVGSVYLFAAINYSNGNIYGKGQTIKQIRSFKMYDGNSSLVRNMIPVRVGTTGYMYDKVSGTLFGNDGTGSFILGPDKTSLYDELLPSLTIQSGQTPAIITDYYPNQNTKFVFKCKLTERPTTAANKVIYGTFTYISNTLYRRIDCQFTNGLKIVTKYGDGSSGLATVVYAVDSVHELTVGNNYIIQDGTTTSYTTAGQFVTDYPLVLFSNCNNGTPSIVSAPAGGFVGTLYGTFDIYEGTTLMRSYIPAKKNGRVGLYERITNKMLFSPYGEFSE